MSVARVTEITSSSPTSFEDAIQKGIDRASKTLKNVEGAWVQDQKVVVENGRIVVYGVNMKGTGNLTDRPPARAHRAARLRLRASDAGPAA